MVAGSTTSAIRAVSVKNCSWTQTNRSSRSNPRLTRFWSGATETGLVFWMNSAVTGGAPRQAPGAASTAPPKARPDSRLIEHPHRPVTDVRPFDHRLVPVIDVGVVVERPAPFVLPRAGDGRDAARRVHVGRAVARAREAAAAAEI